MPLRKRSSASRWTRAGWTTSRSRSSTWNQNGKLEARSSKLETNSKSEKLEKKIRRRCQLRSVSLFSFLFRRLFRTSNFELRVFRHEAPREAECVDFRGRFVAADRL